MRQLSTSVIVFAVLAATTIVARADDADAQLEKKLAAYTETTFQQVKAAPDDYKEKKVTYSGRFVGFSTTFFPYMEKSGFKADRYYGLLVNELAVPVMAKKNNTFKKIMGEIRPGVFVKVYGRVKKYRRKPEQTLFPRYYLRLDHLEIVQQLPGAADRNPGAGAERPPPPGRGRRLLPRRR